MLVTKAISDAFIGFVGLCHHPYLRKWLRICSISSSGVHFRTAGSVGLAGPPNARAPPSPLLPRLSRDQPCSLLLGWARLLSSRTGAGFSFWGAPIARLAAGRSLRLPPVREPCRLCADCGSVPRARHRRDRLGFQHCLLRPDEPLALCRG